MGRDLAKQGCEESLVVELAANRISLREMNNADPVKYCC